MQIGVVVSPQGPAVGLDSGLIFGRVSPHLFKCDEGFNLRTLAGKAIFRQTVRTMAMKLLTVIFGLGAALFAAPAVADVVTRLPTQDKVVALTFDACEAYQPAAFDRSILDYLLSKKIPFTVFASGRFVENNLDDIRTLASLDFVDIENHSWDHPNTMNMFTPAHVAGQVERATTTIFEVTGKPPQFFRFPAGNYNPGGLKAVEEMGYHVVHWRWASGDPDKRESGNALVKRVAEKVRPGDILIFHINGRGWHTGEALPRIVEELTAQGYRFVLVSDYVGTPHDHSIPLPDALSTAKRVITAFSRLPLPINPGGVVN
ncbi:MAG: polysaccharide deacetylase family protein [Micropepsaceae bacterium]